MSGNVTEVLKAAKALIEDPKRWTQGAFARGRTGRIVNPSSKAAVCWCSRGALIKVGDPEFSALMQLFASAYETNYAGPADVNDNTDHPTVMKMFDLAIQKASAEA